MRIDLSKGLLLEPAAPKPQVGELMVAARVPKLDASTFTGTFNPGGGDVVAECKTGFCDWVCMGPRPEVGAAWQEHHRLVHSNQRGVVKLNTPRQ